MIRSSFSSFIQTIRVVALASMVSSLALAPGQSPGAPASSNAPADGSDARVAWWRAARFGMFIHFGLYAIPARGEWVQWNEQIPVPEYARLADQFKPDFQPDAWAGLAKAAGMKYMILTARHHDGFCLFDDGTNTFSTVQTAAHRDLVAGYVQAVRAAGLHVGLYYSPLDWRYPGYFFPDLYRSSAEAMREQYHRQVRELLTNYGQIDVLWFDGGETDWLSFGGDWGPGAEWRKRAANRHYTGGFSWRHDEVYAMLRHLQPDILVNGRADMPPDFKSREGDGALGGYDDTHPWELCLTLAGAWGYQSNATPKSLSQCIHYLAGAAGRDGNLLLNVGPRPDGQIDPPQAERLREIGGWLGKNGESIYDTRGGPFLPGDYGVSTRRDRKIYVHVFQWPREKLVLPSIPAKVLGASFLSGERLDVTQTDTQIAVALPATTAPDPNDTVIALELDQPASGLKTVPVMK